MGISMMSPLSLELKTNTPKPPMKLEGGIVVTVAKQGID